MDRRRFLVGMGLGTVSPWAAANCFDSIDPYYTSYDPAAEIHIGSAADLATLRGTLIAYLWKGAGIPTRGPDAVFTGVASPLPAVSGLARVDLLRINLNFGFVANAYVFRPTVSVNKLAIAHQGHDHGIVVRSLGETIRLLVRNGVTVVALGMPGFAPNTGPVTSHEALGAYDSGTFAAMTLFIDPTIIALNALLAEGFADVGMIGISGGGWTTTLVSAVDTRVRVSYPVAGSYPIALRFGPCPSGGDWEQLNTHGPLYPSASYLDLYLLGACGPGRRQVQCLNQFDPCCFAGLLWTLYEPAVRSRATACGGIFAVNEYSIPYHAIDASSAHSFLSQLVPVALTSPAPDVFYTAPATIQLTAVVPGGGLDTQQVEFLQGATVIATRTAAPFSHLWTNVAAGTYSLRARATDNANVVTTSQPVQITVVPAGSSRNVALQSNGATASASSTLSGSFPPASATNGDRRGLGWGAGTGGWADGTTSYPDWLRVTFAGQRTINRIDVFSVQDAYASPIEPNSELTFTQWGLSAFDVQTWNGSAWVTVPGGVIDENYHVWRTFGFPDIATSSVRVLVRGALGGSARIVELEAWSPSSTNSPPTVSLTAPVGGTMYVAPATVGLAASAADSDGTVSQVEFLQGSTVLATLTGPPYSYSWTNVAAGTYTLTARVTDNGNASTTSAPVTVTVVPAGSNVNVALQSNGGTASASSTYSSSFPAASAINGNRPGNGWGSGTGGWADGTGHAYPDWLEVRFLAPRQINRIDVFTVQDDWANPVNPTPTMVFTSWGITSFDVQTWNGSSWSTVPGGAVTGNNKVWRTFQFADVVTDRIRVLVNGALAGSARITELEAWMGSVPPPVNVALAQNGATATASSTLSAAFPAESANNGDRKGTGWASGGGGWSDATGGSYPDWLQVIFAGQRTINRIDVFTVQDNYANPIDPTPTMTFTQWGITSFDVQTWDGSSWITVPGGAVTGNDKVWRSFTFANVTTDRIRVYVGAALAASSRITEVEAWSA